MSNEWPELDKFRFQKECLPFSLIAFTMLFLTLRKLFACIQLSVEQRTPKSSKPFSWNFNFRLLLLQHIKNNACCFPHSYVPIIYYVCRDFDPGTKSRYMCRPWLNTKLWWLSGWKLDPVQVTITWKRKLFSIIIFTLYLQPWTGLRSFK